jgi:hypothetical protein
MEIREATLTNIDIHAKRVKFYIFVIDSDVRT